MYQPEFNFVSFRHLLLNWFEENKRDLPWRISKDPYLIWLSEIILQQTRVNQGMDYYLKISNRFPSVFDLAAAHEDEVLKLWQGLGYYSRARNMHTCAKEVVHKYNGFFPKDYNQILELKGIGKYTAAAVLSIAFNLPFAVVDGNVIRLISRLFAIEDDVFVGDGNRKITEIANKLLDHDKSGEFNQAMMEFGSLFCTHQNPDCKHCVLNKYCKAYKLDKVSLFPIKKKKIEKSLRIFHFSVPIFDFDGRKSTLLVRRTANDVWKNLFQFPLFENFNKENTQSFDFHTDIKPFFQILSIETSKHYTHILSHQKIEADFTIYKCAKICISSFPEPYLIVSLVDLEKFALPRLVDRFLKENSGVFKESEF